MNERILVVHHRSISKALMEWGFVVKESNSKSTALASFDAESPALTLLNDDLPDGSGIDVLREIKRRQPEAIVIMITSNVLVDDTLAILRHGAHDFIGKPINLKEIRVKIDNAIEARQLHREVKKCRKEKINQFGFDQIIGESKAIKEIKALGEKIAASNITSVLLQGESGTGKGLFAKAIHYSSKRAAKPFTIINCAAIPAGLLESELFGHEKGSFTDAKQLKPGLLEQSAGGTIFLDEIGEMELKLQSKLLRVLDEGIFRRVGGLTDYSLDVRVIAASNRDLKAASDNGTFRNDLYYRLAVVQLDIPPLRARGDDVIILARFFIDRLRRAGNLNYSHRLSPETEKAFRRYKWKGNVRELKNAIERALIFEDSSQITLRYLPKDISNAGKNLNGSVCLKNHDNLERLITFPPEGISLDAVQNYLIEQALRQTSNNVTRASALLGISRDRLRYHLKMINKSSPHSK